MACQSALQTQGSGPVHGPTPVTFVNGRVGDISICLFAQSAVPRKTRFRKVRRCKSLDFIRRAEGPERVDSSPIRSDDLVGIGVQTKGVGMSLVCDKALDRRLE